MILISKKVRLIAIPLLIVGSLGLALWEKTSAPNVTFTSIKGKRISMSDLTGKVVIVNFWATSCLACVQEMPALVNVYKKFHPKGLEIIAVATSDDPPAQVLNYASEKKLPFTVMHDGFAEISQKFGNVNVTPTTFIFDKQGRQLQRTIGTIDFAKLDLLLNSELSVKN